MGRRRPMGLAAGAAGAVTLPVACTTKTSGGAGAGSTASVLPAYVPARSRHPTCGATTTAFATAKEVPGRGGEVTALVINYRERAAQGELPWEPPSRPDRLVPPESDWLPELQWLVTSVDPGDGDALAVKGGHNGEDQNIVVQVFGEALMTELGQGRCTRDYFGPRGMSGW